MKATVARLTIVAALAAVLVMCTSTHATVKDVTAIRKAEGAGHVSGKRWAIVMGVNNYDDARVRDLEFAANDARLMAAALEQSGLYDGVYLFADGEPNAEPTFDNVLMKLSVVTKNAGPNDMILFFFSGHGFPDDQEGHNYLVAKNTNVDLLLKTGIGLQEIYRFLNDSKARSKVVLLDACHSGPRKDKAGDIALSGQYLYNGVGSVAIASSQYEQSSWEWPEKGTGAFTWFLVQGMGGEADVAPFGNGDGLVTSHELNLYVTEAVQSWANQNNRVQTPRADINMTGDVVLGVTGHGQPTVILSQVSTGGSCPAGMVYIPPGSFTMGCSTGDEQCDDNEKPAKQVTISRGYCMDIYEVINRNYAAFLNANGSICNGTECVSVNDQYFRLKQNGMSWQVENGWEKHPVNGVTWYGAKAYCKSIKKRLPTEAQWEYAARGGTTTPYYWGGIMKAGQANFCDVKCSYDYKNRMFNDGYETTSPVGIYSENNYGLYDMLGNVWEWVEDCYDGKWSSTMPAIDPVNICSGSKFRVVRGGAYYNASKFLRVSSRFGYFPSNGIEFPGFRCAADPQ